ncbi:hypothetical protein BSR03_20595 [Serratia proteamaculans]|nr:hypothetical protein BSR03_20595 [Serratia proteamaculans]
MVIPALFMFGFAVLLLTLKFLDGASFVALLTIILVYCVLISLYPNITELTLAGNTIKLQKRIREAELLNKETEALNQETSRLNEELRALNSITLRILSLDLIGPTTSDLDLKRKYYKIKEMYNYRIKFNSKDRNSESEIHSILNVLKINIKEYLGQQFDKQTIDDLFVIEKFKELDKINDLPKNDKVAYEACYMFIQASEILENKEKQDKKPLVYPPTKTDND